MSKRILGGGRVLGSGKQLSTPTPSPQLNRSSSHRDLLPSSPSNLSLDSGLSTPLSLESQDLASKVSLSHGDPSATNAATSASSRLACPICNEEMVGPFDTIPVALLTLI